MLLRYLLVSEKNNGLFPLQTTVHMYSYLIAGYNSIQNGLVIFLFLFFHFTQTVPKCLKTVSGDTITLLSLCLSIYFSKPPFERDSILSSIESRSKADLIFPYISSKFAFQETIKPIRKVM